MNPNLVAEWGAWVIAAADGLYLGLDDDESRLIETVDPMRAIHFARKRDAEIFADTNDAFAAGGALATGFEARFERFRLIHDDAAPALEADAVGTGGGFPSVPPVALSPMAEAMLAKIADDVFGALELDEGKGGDR